MKIGKTCPYCGSEDIAKILYGMRVMTDELKRDLAQRKVVLGGDVLLGHDPAWACNNCGRRFGDREQEMQGGAAAKLAEDGAQAKDAKAPVTLPDLSQPKAPRDQPPAVGGCSATHGCADCAECGEEDDEGFGFGHEPEEYQKGLGEDVVQAYRASHAQDNPFNPRSDGCD